MHRPELRHHQAGGAYTRGIGILSGCPAKTKTAAWNTGRRIVLDPVKQEGFKLNPRQDQESKTARTAAV
jgi:hypothetical protein